MSKIIVLFGILFVIVAGEEESPAAISKAPDEKDTTLIHEELNHEDAHTIRIHILKDVEDDEPSRSDEEKEGAYRLSNDTEKPFTNKEVPAQEALIDDEQAEPKEVDSHGSQKHSGNTDVEKDANLYSNSDAKPSDEKAREEVSRNAAEKNDGSIESDGKDTRSHHHVTLDIKGRQGGVDTLEDVTAVLPEDMITIDSLRPLDNIQLRKSFSDITIPHHYKHLARNSMPYNPGFYVYQPRQPYFGRLANPEPIHGKIFERDIPDNTRVSSTPSEVEWKLLEEYTDPDSNAYVYNPKDPVPRYMPQNIIPLQQKLVDATKKQNINMISQLSPYSNENLNLNYAVNIPYGLTRRFN